MIDLNAAMEFDCPVTIGSDGTVSNGPSDLYAPNLLDEELDSPDWEFFTTGYSGQDSYSGPIMHNSEYIGGRLERDLLAAPGIYCVIVAHWTPEPYSGPDDDDVEGWAVVRYIGYERRLEELRAEIRAERISYGELQELQNLAPYIDPSDVELREWAGIPEHDETEL